MSASAEDRELAGRLAAATNRQIKSVYDLVNGPDNYAELIPILVDALPNTRSSVVKEGIVRALTCKQARGVAFGPLKKEFLAIDDGDSPVKWTIGNALSVVAKASNFEEISALLLDERHGRARQMLADALVSTKDRRAESVLLKVLDDATISAHVISALARVGSSLSRTRLEQLANVSDASTRRVVTRALRQIAKRLERGQQGT